MERKNLLVLSLVFLIAFAIIALILNTNFMNSLNSSVNSFSATHQTPILQTSSIILSSIFEPSYVVIFVLVLSICLWVTKKNKAAILLAISSILGGAFIYTLKKLFSVPRPTNALIADSGFSFPSGHSLISAVLFGILIYLSLGIKSQTRKVISISACVLGILAVGLSRVYLNVHWFSDIIAGYCLGLFLVFAILYLEGFFKIKN